MSDWKDLIERAKLQWKGRMLCLESEMIKALESANDELNAYKHHKQTHSKECWRWHGHSACAEKKVESLQSEIERLTAIKDAAVDQYKLEEADNEHLRARLEVLEKVRERTTWIYNQGYTQGHHDTVESCYTDLHHSDMGTYHEDVVNELLTEALAAEEDK